MYKILFVLIITLAARHIVIAEEYNYIEYHNRITAAQNKFIARNYADGISDFKNIFLHYPKAFAKDCFIATQFACYIEDTTSAIFFIKRGILSGVNWSSLNSSIYVTNLFIRNKAFKNTVVTIYQQYRPQYIGSLNMVLRKRIRGMIDMDGIQKAKIQSRADIQAKKQYTSTLDSNMKELCKIIKEHGYPGEHVVGIYDSEMDAGSTTNFSSLPALLFFHHEYGYQCLYEELMAAVKNGELNPREYALFHDWSYQKIINRQAVDSLKSTPDSRLPSDLPYDYLFTCDVQPHHENYNMAISSKYHSSDTLAVNTARKNAGIATIENDAVRKRFADKNNFTLFFGLFNSL